MNNFKSFNLLQVYIIGSIVLLILILYFRFSILIIVLYDVLINLFDNLYYQYLSVFILYIFFINIFNLLINYTILDRHFLIKYFI